MDVQAWARQLADEGAGALRQRLHQALVDASHVATARARELATTRLHVRSGRLRNSIRSYVEVEGDSVRLRLSAGRSTSELPYARAHEDGATIRPKRGKYLAIPLPAAKTAAGVTRGEFSRLGGLRAVPNLQVIRSKAGNLLLVRPNKDGTVTPLFVLRAGSVVLRARHYLRDALQEAADGLPEAIRGHVEVAVVPRGAA